MDMKDQQLSDLGALSAHTLEVLRCHWIVTAEQLLGAAATAKGRVALGGLLGLSEAEMSGLLERVGTALGPSVDPASLRRPQPGGALGLDLVDPSQTPSDESGEPGSSSP